MNLAMAADGGEMVNAGIAAGKDLIGKGIETVVGKDAAKDGAERLADKKAVNFNKSIGMDTAGGGQAAGNGAAAVRQAYEAEVGGLADQAAAARAAGQDPEAIARQLVDSRNSLKLKYRAQSPADAVLKFEQRNIKEYGNPVGPSADQLHAAGKTWDQIIESAARPGGSDLGF